MKIAVLSSHTPSLFWFRIDMMKAFLQKGYQVVAVGNEPEDDENHWKERFSQEGIAYRRIAISRNGTNPLKDLETLRSIKQVFREELPDKLFLYQAKTVIYGSLAAKSLGIREVYALIAGVGSVFVGKGLKTWAVRMILKMEYRKALRHCKKVFFQNQDDRSDFTRLHLVNGEKTVLINGSGVNLERFEKTPLPEIPSFIYIGRLLRDKGIGEYLEAARQVKKMHPETRFLLVGPFDTNPSSLQAEDLQPYLDDCSIEYFGFQEDVRPYLAQSAVCVLPSYHEGTPKTVLEAMAMGRAVLTTDAPGCRETVQDGWNGYLVPVADVGALAGKMADLIQFPQRILEMGANSYRLAGEKYDVKLVNAKIMATMGL